MTVSWTGTIPGQSVMNRSTPVHAAELYRTGTAEEGRSSGSILENLNRNMLALTSHYTRKIVPITRRASSFLENILYVRTSGFKNKIERRKRRSRQNNNRPINLPQGNNILHILHVHHLTLNTINIYPLYMTGHGKTAHFAHNMIFSTSVCSLPNLKKIILTSIFFGPNWYLQILA